MVYRARDLRLDRVVALKVLPPELARDAEAKARFLQEAKAASALDHPNICTVFEIDETADGQLFLVLAYYAGETLKKAIARGPLPVDQALDIATQIGLGLQKAHAAGIIHRDIKPANLMFTADGVVKIVDFGLAKLADATGLTRPGTALGTVAYMAPEQTRGEAVDARADLWALGVVLYEMVAGRLPFGGDTAAAMAAAIQQQTPVPLTALRTGVPKDLDHLMARALAPDPAERFQTAADVLADLQRVRRASDATPASASAPGPGARGPSRVGLGVMGTAALAVVLAGALLWPRGADVPRVPRFVNPVQVTNAIGMEDYPSWSPDGQTLAFAGTQNASPTSGNWDIWVTQVGGGPPVNRTADHAGDDWYPSWSPDGKQIAFWSDREGGGYYVMPAQGGTPRRSIGTPGARGDAGGAGNIGGRPAWSPDGTELAGAVLTPVGYALTITALSSDQSRHADLPTGLIGIMDLSWSPDGRLMAFVDGRPLRTTTYLYAGRLGNDGFTAITDGRTKVWSPAWSDDGRTLYFVQNGAGTMDLWQQPLTEAGGPTGPPLALTTGVEMQRAAFSRDGRRLAYSKGRRVGNVWRMPIRPDRPATWADAEQLTFDQALVQFVDVSPDGTRLLISSDRSGNSDLRSLPSTGGEMRPMTSDPTPDWNPRWSPDGQQVAFYASRTGKREIWVQSAAGGPARQLSRADTDAYWPSWSPDGRQISFYTVTGSSSKSGSCQPPEGTGMNCHPVVTLPRPNGRAMGGG